MRAEPSGSEEFDKIRMAHLYDSARSRFLSANEFALLGLRSALLANAGALAALLAFLGTKDSVLNAHLMISLFAAGLACALSAVLAGFVTQSIFSHTQSYGAEKIYLNQRGQLEAAKQHEALEHLTLKQGSRWRKTAVVLFCGSVIAFSGGASIGAYSIWIAS